MPSEIDTSSGGGIAARLAKLKLQQQADSASSAGGRERPTPPARRFNTAEIPLIAPRPAVPSPKPPVAHQERDTPFPAKKAPPPLPTRRTNSLQQEAPQTQEPAPPPPPPRSNSNASLEPPRLPVRKASSGSIGSLASNTQSSRAPPPQPPRPPHSSNREPNTGPQKFKILAPESPPPALPPRLPPRRPTSGSEEQPSHSHSNHHNSTTPTTPSRRLPPPPSEAPAPITSRTWQHNSPPTPPPVPSRPAFTSGPPPIPSTSRPSLPPTRPAPPITPPYDSPTSPSNCLVCRDFSHADAIAAQPHLFRTNVPSLEWLAEELCSPFPYSTIDKARAIFTWLHHNISYDAVGFANKTPFRGTPLETIRAGLSVCQGYAEIFFELCILGGVPRDQVQVVSGFGKGAGYKEMQPGDPIPEERQGHAWNAIYFPEEGFQRWHLIDPCWGAGHISGPVYTKKFKPSMFTQSPAQFGKRHFPKDRRWQCREDGEVMSWEDFITMELRMGQSVLEYTQLAQLGFSKHQISPQVGTVSDSWIQQRGGRVTFSLAKACPHMQIDMREEYVYLLSIDGAGENFPFEPPSPGAQRGSWESVTWSVTLDFRNHPKLRGLRMDGRKIMAMNVTSFDERDGKGLAVRDWMAGNGRVAQGFST
ncbi:hypothetical protein DFH27DRAFT_524764 [Peziza echinospora]|nr:hypothetical protein DFH27DRAFT_524764 [Peziza echinospora]